KNGTLQCVVIDTGIGIPPGKLDRLFEKFYQAASSTTRRYGGTGLGLVISKELTLLMGGTLTVTSQMGQGSSFTLQLPAPRYEGSLPAPQPSLSTSSPFPTTSETEGQVLLVDDNAINRKLAAIMLRKLGYK